MQIYSIFQLSIYTELVTSELKQHGISSIFAIPLDDFNEHPQIFDTINRSDGVSFINIGMCLSVVFSTILASRGFEMKLGPIIWGLIGAGGGFFIGFFIDLFLYKWKKGPSKRRKEEGNLVILVVECKKEEEIIVFKILANNRALGLAKLNQ